jgi:hypothetical protein
LWVREVGLLAVCSRVNIKKIQRIFIVLPQVFGGMIAAINELVATLFERLYKFRQTISTSLLFWTQQNILTENLVMRNVYRNIAILN